MKPSPYFFNKVVMVSIHQWVQKHIDNNDGTVPDILMKMKTKGYNMKAINGFTDDEIKILKGIDTDPEFMGIKAKEISYLVHALLVLKMWVEDIPKKDRPLLNISDTKLKHGRAVYFKHMLLAKEQDPSLYASEKGIIEDTDEAATKWYQYFRDQLYKEVA